MPGEWISENRESTAGEKTRRRRRRRYVRRWDFVSSVTTQADSHLAPDTRRVPGVWPAAASAAAIATSSTTRCWHAAPATATTTAVRDAVDDFAVGSRRSPQSRQRLLDQLRLRTVGATSATRRCLYDANIYTRAASPRYCLVLYFCTVLELRAKAKSTGSHSSDENMTCYKLLLSKLQK